MEHSKGGVAEGKRAEEACVNRGYCRQRPQTGGPRAGCLCGLVLFGLHSDFFFLSSGTQCLYTENILFPSLPSLPFLISITGLSEHIYGMSLDPCPALVTENPEESMEKSLHIRNISVGSEIIKINNILAYISAASLKLYHRTDPSQCSSKTIKCPCENL